MNQATGWAANGEREGADKPDSNPQLVSGVRHAGGGRGDGGQQSALCGDAESGRSKERQRVTFSPRLETGARGVRPYTRVSSVSRSSDAPRDTAMEPGMRNSLRKAILFAVIAFVILVAYGCLGFSMAKRWPIEFGNYPVGEPRTNRALLAARHRGGVTEDIPPSRHRATRKVKKGRNGKGASSTASVFGGPWRDPRTVGQKDRMMPLAKADRAEVVNGPHAVGHHDAPGFAPHVALAFGAERNTCSLSRA